MANGLGAVRRWGLDVALQGRTNVVAAAAVARYAAQRSRDRLGLTRTGAERGAGPPDGDRAPRRGTGA